MDHNWKPRNFRELQDANRFANGFNPFCGDTVDVYLRIEDNVVTDVGFQGSGCAISRASASMMTEAVKGKTTAEAEAVFEEFRRMLTRGPEDEDLDYDSLGDLDVLSGVSQFPTRIKCATLSWHAMKAALTGEDNVSTE